MIIFKSNTFTSSGVSHWRRPAKTVADFRSEQIYSFDWSLDGKQLLVLRGTSSKDIALMPFALNESTRFISPTKTPEYLAAGKPVVSTSIRDVVRPYGELGLVRIADTTTEFVSAIEAAMQEDASARMREVDAFLSQTSWDRTWRRMADLIDDVIATRSARQAMHSIIDPINRASASAMADYAVNKPNDS